MAFTAGVRDVDGQRWLARLRREAAARGEVRLGPGLSEAVRQALGPWDRPQASWWLLGAAAVQPSGAFVVAEGEAPPSFGQDVEVWLAVPWLDDSGRCRLREALPSESSGRARRWVSERAVVRFEAERATVLVEELAPGLSARELQADCPVGLWAEPSLRAMQGEEP